MEPLTRELPTADFYGVEDLLSDRERGKLAEVRDFLDAEIRPHAAAWWDAAEFPFQILPKLAALEIGTPVRRGYSHLFTGLLIAELSRADVSLATFFMVHHDLFVESLHRFGSAEQRARLLDDAASLRTTGAFALTEPDHGSDVARGLATTAVRDGDEWVLNGSKRWIGNGTFCDHMLLWARDETPGSVGAIRGFIVAGDLPGLKRTRIEGKTALRTVQNADIELHGVRVPEEDRFAGIASFADTNELLRGSRALVAWQAVGQQLAAFDVARSYAVQRRQFGKPIGSFQMVQDRLVRILGNAVSGATMMTRVAQLEERGLAGMPQIALAKAHITSAMRESVGHARAVLGGNGIVTGFGAAKVFADAEAIYTYEGSYEVNTLIVGREITGVSAIH
ncbi:acyl-CoA dehydrogenase family protein [Arthrobacter sp. NPDC090010]|uniref:acyl-CoA dehydrogenase family protein n=1 Tax=Arthrobacter sp. NPDC090010 TaxID=3363942 RepID=UPI003806B123